jgi:hypothetical protein
MRQELESMPLAEFHDELRLALTSYYEGIVKMEGASGINKKVAYKRPIKRISLEIIQDPPPPAHDADSEAAPAAAGAAAPDAAGAAAPAAAAAAAPPPRKSRRGGGESQKCKTINTIQVVLELECVFCETSLSGSGKYAAFGQARARRAGAAGNESLGQATYRYASVRVLVYRSTYIAPTTWSNRT